MVQKDLFNPLYIKGVARKLAMINCLDAPINKKSNWLISKLNSFNSIIKQKIKVEDVDENHKEIAKELLAIDFESEIKWVIKHVLKVESPLVFCNNDVFPPNILVRTDILDHINKLGNKKDELFEKLLDELIVIIDFEFCSYNFRGSEIGNYFNEHLYEYNTPSAPYFIADENKFPDENHRRSFVEEYLLKLKQIKGELSEIDTVDHILKEVEAYQIGHNLFWILSGICYSKYITDYHKFDFWVTKYILTIKV